MFHYKSDGLLMIIEVGSDMILLKNNDYRKLRSPPTIMMDISTLLILIGFIEKESSSVNRMKLVFLRHEIIGDWIVLQIVVRVEFSDLIEDLASREQ